MKHAARQKGGGGRRRLPHAPSGTQDGQHSRTRSSEGLGGLVQEGLTRNISHHGVDVQLYLGCDRSVKKKQQLNSV